MAVSLEEAELQAQLAFVFKVTGFSAAWKDADKSPLSLRDLKVGGATFRLSLQRNGSEAADRHVGVHLYREDDGANPASANFTMTLAKGRNQKVSRSFDKGFWFVPQWANSDDEHHSSCCGWDQCLPEADLLAHVSTNGDDTARIRCKIEVTSPQGLSPLYPSRCIEVDAKAVMNSRRDLVKLRASSAHEISMPRALLCQVSDVFKAELGSCMQEGTSAILEIQDASERQLEDFALCLETGGLHTSVTTSLDRVMDLLKLADKYQVLSLVDACIWVLSMAMSTDNAARFLKFAEQHNLSKLYRAVVCFAASGPGRMQSVMNSDEFVSLRADTLRDLMALALPKQQGRDADSKEMEEEPPPFLQWGDAANNFEDGTNWAALTANDLRRACLERSLATSGTSGELVLRLSSRSKEASGGSPSKASVETGEPSSKRPRVAE